MDKEKEKKDLDYRADLYASEMKRIRQDRIIYVLSIIVLIFAIVIFVLTVRRVGEANVTPAA